MARRAPLALVLLLAGLLLVAGVAWAAWTDPDDLSPAGRNAFSPQVGVESSGKALAVWTRFDGSKDRVQARTRTAAGDLSSTQTLSDPGQNAAAPQVAVDPSGDAAVVWQRSDGTNTRVQVRAGSAAGVLSSVQTLSGSGQNALIPQVAVDPSGNALAVWIRFDGANYRVQARARSAAGVLSSVQTLSDPGQNGQEPQVAMDPSGNALVVWTQSDGTNNRVWARARSAGGVLSAVQPLSDAGRDAFNGQVGVDASGNAVVVWTRFDSSDNRVQARARTAGGVLSAVQNLSAAGESAGSPQVAVVRSSGNAVAVWTRFDTFNFRVQARARSAGGVLGSVQTLSAAMQDATIPQVGVDSSGNAAVVWRRSDGSNFRVQARARTAAGALSAIATPSPLGQDAAAPQVGVGSAGQAVAIWQQTETPYTRVQASGGP